MNIGVHVTFWIVVFSGYMPSIGMLGHMIVLFLVFWGIFTVFFIVAVFIYIPAVQEHSLFSTSFPAFIVCRFFDDGHFDCCELIPHCSFDLHFSNDEQCWSPFHVLISHLYVFFGEMSFQACLPVFDRVVCFSGIELHELFVYSGD